MATIIKKQTIERQVEKVFADAKLTGRVSTDAANNVVSFSGTIYTGENKDQVAGTYNFNLSPSYYGDSAPAFDEAKFASYVKELITEVENQIKA